MTYDRESQPGKKPKRNRPNKKLKRARELLGWTQKQLATHIGTTQAEISLWECGRTTPGPYLRVQLCKALGQTSEELGLLPEDAEEISEQAAGQSPIGQSSSPESSKQHRAETSSKQEPSSRSYWYMPYPRDVFFIGREEVLADIYLILNKDDSVISVLAISGLGGMGKSYIALEYAYRHREEYQSVFWVTAESLETLVTDFRRLASLLKLSEQHEQDPYLIAYAVKAWLRQHASWLLIFDNVEDLKVIREFLPQEGRGHVLLTTTTPTTDFITHSVEIKAMDLEEGSTLLLRRAKSIAMADVPDNAREDEWEKAKEITAEMDGLPLALDQAAAYMEETPCSASDYLNLYRSRRSILLGRRGWSRISHPLSLATTFSLTFDKVKKDNQLAIELLRLCAFFHPSEIPEEIITQGASLFAPPLQPLAVDPLLLGEAIGALRKYSLIRRSSERQTLSLHRLVQIVLKASIDERDRSEWAMWAMLALNSIFTSVATATGQLPSRYTPSHQESAKLIKRLARVFANLDEKTQFAVAEQMVRDLENALCPFEATTIQRYERYLPHAQAIAEPIKHMEMLSAQSATLLFRAGSIFRDQGLYPQAEALSKQALEMYVKLLGSEHPTVARCATNVALLYMDIGIYDMAQLYFQYAQMVYEKTLRPNHPHITENLNYLARIYLLRRNFERAKSSCEQARKIYSQMPVPPKLEVAHCLSTLGKVYMVEEEYEQASSLVHKAKAIRERMLEQDHPDVAESYFDLANLATAQGNFSQAEQFIQRVLSTQEKVLGVNHPHIMSYLDTLALIRRKQESYEEAEALYQHIITIRQQKLRPDHPYIALSHRHLADLYKLQGKDAEAELHEQEEKAVYAKHVEMKPGKELSTLERLLSTIIKTGNEKEATRFSAFISYLRESEEQKSRVSEAKKDDGEQ